MPSATRYRSVTAAIAAARRLANRTGRSVTVLVPKRRNATGISRGQALDQAIIRRIRAGSFGSIKTGQLAAARGRLDRAAMWRDYPGLRRAAKKNPRRGRYPKRLASKYIRQEFRAGRKGKQAVAIGIARARRASRHKQIGK